MPEQVKRNPWIAFRKGGHHSRARLFCFPYAGAGASVFRSWGDYLSPEFEVIGVQLPGREERLRDELFVRIEPMVESAAKSLCSDLTAPFAFFGHSMGSILAYELACFLRRNGLPQ